MYVVVIDTENGITDGTKVINHIDLYNVTYDEEGNFVDIFQKTFGDPVFPMAKAISCNGCAPIRDISPIKCFTGTTTTTNTTTKPTTTTKTTMKTTTTTKATTKPTTITKTTTKPTITTKTTTKTTATTTKTTNTTITTISQYKCTFFILQLIKIASISKGFFRVKFLGMRYFMTQIVSDAIFFAKPSLNLYEKRTHAKKSASVKV